MSTSNLEEVIDAVKTGNMKTIEELCRHECLSKEDAYKIRPIHWACVNGHADVIHLLMDRGAEIEAADENGRRLIHWACMNGHADVVRMLMDYGCDIEAADQNGRRPIHFACKNGHADVIQLLIHHGCHIEAADQKGRIPIHWACENGHADVVRMLMDYGCHIVAADQDGRRPIHWACMNGHAAVVQVLMEHGCDIEAADQDGRRPIQWACMNGHAAVVQVLMEHGCDIEAVDQNGRRPIHWACENGHADVVRMLMDYGCDIEAADQNGRRPIHFACKNGHAAVIQLLIHRGCHIEAADQDGRRPIHWVCMNGHAAVVQVLMEHGCDIEAVDQGGWRPIHWACENGHTGIVHMLLDRWSNIEAQSKNGWRPIHLACANGYADVVQILLGRGSDIIAKSKDGWRTIHLACITGHVDVVQLLLDEGCEIEEPDLDGRRPIHLACWNGHAAVVQLLLDRGSDIEAKSKDLWRPIHFACAKGNVDIVKLLLWHGCQIESSNRWRQRPVHFACERGHTNIVQLLLDSGCEIEVVDECGQRPIHFSCSSGHVDVVQLLLEYGCVMRAADRDGWWPIHWACANGHADVVQLLLDEGCEIEEADFDGRRPIHLACWNGHASLVRLLLEKGCVINAQTKDGRTPYDFTRESCNDECSSMIKRAEKERMTDEFQIFHLPTFSVVSRKYKIYDLFDVVDKIKKEIPCMKRPVVVCNLTDPLRRLPPSKNAFIMLNDGLQYAEYLIEDASGNKDCRSQIAELRDWDVRVAVNASDSEINLEIQRQADSTKWNRYATVTFELFNYDIHMLVKDHTEGAVLKKTFVDFQRFVYCGELFKTLDGNQTGTDAIDLINKWITTRKEMLTFYLSDGEKLSDSWRVSASGTGNAVWRISVVQRAPKQIEFIPSLPKSEWSWESISKIVSHEHILIRCITDDEQAYAIPRSDCKTVSDVKDSILPLSLCDDMKGRLMLVGSDGQLSDDIEVDKLASVIHYAVVLPYENVRKLVNIGRGSYSLISKCKIGNDENIYAMKEMVIYDRDSEEDKRIQINEVMVVGQIGSHPNVVKYRRFYEDNLAFYIIMDFMKESLFDHIRSKYPLKETTIIHFAKQIIEGLKHLHDHKVIHRDIKCKNVLLDENDCVKLCDFGISKCQNVDTGRAAREGGKTQVGTLRYMAPELLGLDRPETYGQKTDIWQFGLLMVEMITGREPYPGLSDIKVFGVITKSKTVEYKFPPMYSRELKEFVDCCLDYDPSNRPTCAKLLQHAVFKSRNRQKWFVIAN